MIEIATPQIALRWNNQSELIDFFNKSSKEKHFQQHSVCRLILERPDLLEFEVVPAGKCNLKKLDSNMLQFCYENCMDDDGKCYKIPVVLTIKIEKNDVHWGIYVENETDSITIREIHYPILSIRDPNPPMCLHTSELVSTTYPNLPEMLRGEFTSYMAPDQKYIRHISTYPGRTSSMNFFLLDYGNENLYFACYDPDFMMTNHGFEIEKGDKINCFMARMPFLKPGNALQENVMITSLLSSDWTLGTKKYREWANTWFQEPIQTTHVRNSFGWQRLIMHHQYGEYFFCYQDLPKLLDDGLPAGIDTIFLFGWTKEGMDSGYPTYTPDPVCGGFDELRKNIQKVHEKGGHVIIYYNGQLIDASSDYYRNGDGQKVSIKRMDGTEHREFYNFSNTGTFTKTFGNKTFVVACPSCRNWINILKKHVDFAFELGADGVFFDQLGLASYPCCDPTHGHPVPFIGLMKSKMKMLHELQVYVKSKSPDFSIGVECPTDQTAQYCDFVHIFGNTAQVWNEDFRKKKERPLLKSAVPLFKTTFPEVYLSDRDIRDDSNVEFAVNQMALLGRRTDAEVFRCRASLAAAPKYQAYLTLVNRLRNRFKDILLHGTPVDSKYHHIDDTRVLSNAFLLGRNLAVIITQSSDVEISTSIEVPGYHLTDYASAKDNVSCLDGKISLPCDSLLVLLYTLEKRI